MDKYSRKAKKGDEEREIKFLSKTIHAFPSLKDLNDALSFRASMSNHFQHLI